MSIDLYSINPTEQSNQSGINSADNHAAPGTGSNGGQNMTANTATPKDNSGIINTQASQGSMKINNVKSNLLQIYTADTLLHDCAFLHVCSLDYNYHKTKHRKN